MPCVKGGTMIVGDDVRRFWSKTKKGPGGCVLWTGVVDKDGYGKFMVGPRWLQRTHRPHRWIWERCIGPIGDALILHSCDTPGCVALQHLSPGTQKQNIGDAIRRGRFPRGNNQKLTAAQVTEIRASDEASEALAERYGVSVEYLRLVRRGAVRRAA